MKFNLTEIKNNILNAIPFQLKQNKNTQKQEQYYAPEERVINYYVRDIIDSVFDGEKFLGGFGATKDYTYVDYYTLRIRSVQLFKENQYARGLIRRLITNEIYKGLSLESNPIPQIIGITEDEAVDWAADVELKWKMWSENAYICDFNQIKNLGQITADIRQTALLSGDCLVILRTNRKTGLPCIEVVDGSHIQTPFGKTVREGNYIKHGIEFSGTKQVAYWIYINRGNNIYDWERVPCWGEKSKRRIAWMVYGSDKRLDECRGEPLLSNMLYMLKDLDRYRDASARAAVVNSLYPFIIKTTEKAVGTMPFGAVKRTDEVQVVDSTGATTQQLNFGVDNPGSIPKLPYGVDVSAINIQKSDINLGKFEEIILDVIAWSSEIPPEILKLKFDSNYSASRQANNELQIYIDKRAWMLGNEFLQNLYEEWVISAVLQGIIKADGLIESWFSEDWIKYGAWLITEWSGLNRPSVDGFKDAQEEELKLKTLTGTFDDACRRLSKKRFLTVLKTRSNELKMMEKYGLTSSVDEDSTGKPIQQTAIVNEELLAELITNNLKNQGA